MTDPAIEAAQRAWPMTSLGPLDVWNDAPVSQWVIAAARVTPTPTREDLVMNPNPATAESLVFGRLIEMAVELHRALVGNAISSRRVRRAEVQALIDRLIGA